MNFAYLDEICSSKTLELAYSLYTETCDSFFGISCIVGPYVVFLLPIFLLSQLILKNDRVNQSRKHLDWYWKCL